MSGAAINKSLLNSAHSSPALPDPPSPPADGKPHTGRGLPTEAGVAAPPRVLRGNLPRAGRTEGCLGGAREEAAETRPVRPREGARPRLTWPLPDRLFNSGDSGAGAALGSASPAVRRAARLPGGGVRETSPGAGSQPAAPTSRRGQGPWWPCRVPSPPPATAASPQTQPLTQIPPGGRATSRTSGRRRPARPPLAPSSTPASRGPRGPGRPQKELAALWKSCANSLGGGGCGRGEGLGGSRAAIAPPREELGKQSPPTWSGP